jgi:hypothetical protein
MSTDIPSKIVDKAKNKLQSFFDNMRVSNNDFYKNIKLCFDLFWKQYSQGYEPIPMELPEAIDIIKQEVMPNLRKAHACIHKQSPYWFDFHVMYNFFEKWFGSSSQPPPDKVLNEVSNSEKSEQETHFNEVLNVEESQHEHSYDMHRINIVIATLQQQMNALPSILFRLDNLEAKVTSLHQQTSKPLQNTPEEAAQAETPAKTPENIARQRRRLGTFPGEKDPFSSSGPSNPRSDMHQQASIDTLLQKIRDLETDV